MHHFGGSARLALQLASPLQRRCLPPICSSDSLKRLSACRWLFQAVTQSMALPLVSRICKVPTDERAAMQGCLFSHLSLNSVSCRALQATLNGYATHSSYVPPKPPYGRAAPLAGGYAPQAAASYTPAAMNFEHEIEQEVLRLEAAAAAAVGVLLRRLEAAHDALRGGGGHHDGPLGTGQIEIECEAVGKRSRCVGCEPQPLRACHTLSRNPACWSGVFVDFARGIQRPMHAKCIGSSLSYLFTMRGARAHKTHFPEHCAPKMLPQGRSLPSWTTGCAKTALFWGAWSPSAARRLRSRLPRALLLPRMPMAKCCARALSPRTCTSERGWMKFCGR